ncbi:MAG: MarR family transcriptional regulator [Frankiaceae bacterium]|nr:MarR family transcriptional regulator [Frankiaceae bacterium]
MSTEQDADELVNRLRIAIGKISRAMDRQIASGAMTRTQSNVLGTIIRRGQMRLGDLAELENINPTMLSRVVAKLDAAGYIRRMPDPADLRAVLIEATDEGVAAHALARAQRTALLGARLVELPEPDDSRLRAALPALEHLGDAMLRRGTPVVPEVR